MFVNYTYFLALVMTLKKKIAGYIALEDHHSDSNSDDEPEPPPSPPVSRRQNASIDYISGD